MKPYRLPFLFALAFQACIEDRLSVDITTRILPDGTMLRRTEYRLERVDLEKEEKLLALPRPEEDLLRRLHRFPTGERWTLVDEPGEKLHRLVTEATLAYPHDLDWDFWRVRRQSAAAAPARNTISFAMEEEGPGAVYDYAEVFRDPASPLEGARRFAELLLKKDGDFAGRFRRAFGEGAPREADVKRAYREQFALPLGRETSRLAARPLFGPQERQRLERLLDRLDVPLADALQALAPGADSAKVRGALDDAFEGLGELVLQELEGEGLPAPFALGNLASDGPFASIRFRATLIMPAPIVRANTCVDGETAVWEFDQDDLYGRGFEMWAKATGR